MVRRWNRDRGREGVSGSRGRKRIHPEFPFPSRPVHDPTLFCRPNHYRGTLALCEFLAEVSGNDRGTSVNLRGCYHGLPLKSPFLDGKFQGSWHFYGKSHGCGRGTCRGSIGGKLGLTNHGNQRKSASTAAGFADVQPRKVSRPSAAVRGHLSRKISDTRQKPRKSADVRGNCYSTCVVPTVSTHETPQKIRRKFPSVARKSAEVRGNSHSRFRGRLTAAIATTIRIHCYGNLPIRGNYHGIPLKVW